MRRRLLWACTAALCLAQSPAAALSGALFDELGGPVIAAKLTLRGEDGRVYLGRTTEQGTFRLLRVEPGKYALSIDQPGFCKLEVTAVTLAAGQEKALPRMILMVPPEGQNCP